MTSCSEVAECRGAGVTVLLTLIGFYQRCLSPVLPSACRFYPTCSEYAKQAVARHGAKRGAWMTLRRLLRCRPFGPSGYDPVE